MSDKRSSRSTSTQGDEGGDYEEAIAEEEDEPGQHEHEDQQSNPSPGVGATGEHTGPQLARPHTPTPLVAPIPFPPIPVAPCGNEHPFGHQTTHATSPIPQRHTPTQPTQNPHTYLQPTHPHTPTPLATPTNLPPTPVAFRSNEWPVSTHITRVTKPIPQRPPPQSNQRKLHGGDGTSRDMRRMGGSDSHTNRTPTRQSQSRKHATQERLSN